MFQPLTNTEFETHSVRSAPIKKREGFLSLFWVTFVVKWIMNHKKAFFFVSSATEVCTRIMREFNANYFKPLFLKKENSVENVPLWLFGVCSTYKFQIMIDKTTISHNIWNSFAKNWYLHVYKILANRCRCCIISYFLIFYNHIIWQIYTFTLRNNILFIKIYII